jgi:hypothetical protein
MNYCNRDLILEEEELDGVKFGKVYVGDYSAANDKRALKEDEIRTVITAALGLKLIYSKYFTHKILPLNDVSSEPIHKYF